ncbi:MAG: BREX-2 system phosphatase PglZ, partial [Planctomycetota bacterium]
MSASAPTFSQIRAQVAAIRQKVPSARVIGIRSTGRWTGNRERREGEDTYLIDQCDSPLAMRLALRERNENATHILVTPLDDKDLGDDILVRLTKRRLFAVNSWQIVRSLFQARTVDPRLTRHNWIADYLMDAVPPDGYPPAGGGFLDAETVWPILLGRAIGLTVDRPDLQALLKWSTDAKDVARFRAAPEAFRQAATEWLTTLAGPAAEVVLRCVAGQEQPDAVPIGLAAGVIFHPSAEGKLEKATGRLEERYLGGQSPSKPEIERCNSAASEVVRVHLTDPGVRRHLLQRADEILQEVGAEAFAHLSDTSPLGFDQRLAQFGAQLSEAFGPAGAVQLEPLNNASDHVLAHDRARREPRRCDRVRMAVRLARWLTHVDQKSVQVHSLAEASADHLAQGSFVDWARLSLRAGDPLRAVSEAYAKLFEHVTVTREQQSLRFATLLKDATAAGSHPGGILPIERVLEEVVAPLAASSPVLVIVIDGMSAAVFRELMTDIGRHEWVSLVPEGSHATLPAVATIPSVTEVSRTSLLCGRLLQGHSDREKMGFTEQPALLKHCRITHPPVLFHKPSLQETEDSSLAGEVRKEIGSAHRRVVGVVVNAVDDHLLKGEQIDTRWSRDEIKVLPSLLHEAKTARRLVVLLSDHGHVLDCGTEGRPHEGGERWRDDDGKPASDEMAVTGPRVMVTDSKRLIAPWSERVRYGIKKNGYHGGLSPQEMVVPIAVLCATENYPHGWGEAPVDIPNWWEEPSGPSEAKVEEPPALKPTEPKPGLLFDLEGEEPEVAQVDESRETTRPAAWISALLRSPVFKEQKQLGGRSVPADDVFSRLLAAVDARGGKITSAALARAIEYPPLRLRGLLAVAQRVLNVDGYAVLTRDENS